MHPDEIQELLRHHQQRLWRVAVYQARTRPGLDPEELSQQAAEEFLRRQEAWFAQPPRDSRAAQAWILLRHGLLHAVTRHDRRQRVERGLSLEPAGGLDLLEERDLTTGELRVAGEQRWIDAEAEVLLRQALEARIAGLSNPVYRLVIKAIDVRRLLGPGDFEQADGHRVGGARAFVRPWAQAAELILGRPARPADEAWRRFVALCMRTEGDPDTSVDTREVKLATRWLDRNLSRARTALVAG